MRKRYSAITILGVLSCVGLANATYSRVESMGKHATFFMDDISIFDNPANANIYPNYLMGEMGQVRQNGIPAGSDLSALARFNKDPQDPWFGAVFAKSFSKDQTGANRYPQLVVGATFNRDDELNKFVIGAAPASKAEGILGFTTPGGVMLGAKAYYAISDTINTPAKLSRRTEIQRYDLGVNLPIQGADVEFSVGLGFITQDSTNNLGVESAELGGDPSILVNARGFLAMPAINGEVVPSVRFRQIGAPAKDQSDLSAGIGVNVSLDRGFFWLGGEYMYSAITPTTKGAPDTASNGARVSFGIERNIWWDWFVIRVGGQKTFETVEIGNGDTASYWATNPEGNGTENDHISFGIGLNIEDKLKVDAVIAEDILFTGGNLLGGPVDHVFSRISATYSF